MMFVPKFKEPETEVNSQLLIVSLIVTYVCSRAYARVLLTHAYVHVYL